MNEMQAKLLEMFTWLTAFLHKNNLHYYMIGGTMLGAARHNGFIPWDDDIDIAMPRSDYEKAIELLKDPIEHYYIESPKHSKKDYLCGYAKFYDLNTTLVEDVKKQVVRGLFIDIFPLDGIGDEYDKSLKNYKKVDRQNMLLAMKVSKIRKARKWWKNAATVVGSFMPVNSRKLASKLDKTCARFDFDKSTYVGNLMSTYRSKEIMKRELFGKPTLYKFENIEAYGPEKFDEYLETLFHNWRQLPPEDKRVTAHDFSYLNLTEPFSSYKK